MSTKKLGGRGSYGPEENFTHFHCQNLAGLRTLVDLQLSVISTFELVMVASNQPSLLACQHIGCVYFVCQHIGSVHFF